MATTTTTAPIAAAAGGSASSGVSVGARAKTWAVLAGPPLVVFVLIIGAWYAVHATMGSNSYLLPTPGQIIKGSVQEATVRTTILQGLWHTMLVSITGLAIAAAIGIAWAVLMAMARWFQRSTYPYAVILQTIPILAIVPLIGIWFGYQFGARVVVCVIISLFPMVANTLFGLQSVEKLQLELFKLQRASRFTILWKLMLPAAMPSIFLGLRTSAGLSVVGALVGDYFFQQGTPGLGASLLVYTRQLLMPQLFGAILVAALLGVFMFMIFGLLAKLVVGKWYEAAN